MLALTGAGYQKGQGCQKRGRLRRTACGPCRFGKKKCDGARPICSQCLEAALVMWEDCEYSEGVQRTHAEVLQEKIARIEKRIHKLEHPRPKLAEKVKKAADKLHLPPNQSESPYATTLTVHGEPLETSNVNGEPREFTDTLVDLFLASSSEFGFFLNPIRFRTAALLPFPIGHHARPTPALSAAVLTWIFRLSLNPSRTQSTRKEQETSLLERALWLTQNALSNSSLHPHKVLHTLQAEVLLAHYFFEEGRWLEGKYHTAVAVALALGARLDAHVGTGGAFTSASRFPASKLVLSPPQDTIEEEERVHAWWTVVVLDQTWAAALHASAHQRLDPDDDIHRIPQAPAVEVLAKASILWARADALSRHMPRTSHFASEIHVLESLIDDLRLALSSIPKTADTAAEIRILRLAYIIVHAAAMQLHIVPTRTLLPASSTTRQKRTDAAREILELAVNAPRQNDPPILGVVFLSAWHAFSDEMQLPPTENQNMNTASLTTVLVPALT